VKGWVVWLVLLALPGARALALEDAGEAELHGKPGEAVTRSVLLDAWDAGDSTHLLALHGLSAPLPGTEAKLHPARGAGAWLALGSDGAAWSVGSEFRATVHGWDGQMLLELRFRMPNASTSADLVLTSDDDTAALAVRTALVPDLPVPAASTHVGVVGQPAPSEGQWALPEPPMAAPPPVHTAPGLPFTVPISLALVGLLGARLLGRRQP